MITYIQFLMFMALVSIFLGFLSFLGGKSLTHKVLALDLMSLISASIMGIYAVMVDNAVYLDIIIVWALVNFLGTVAFSIFIKEKSSDESEETL